MVAGRKPRRSRGARWRYSARHHVGRADEWPGAHEQRACRSRPRHTPDASQHLAKLTQARLVGVIKQGRFSYYRILSPLVARMLESIIAVAAIDVPVRYRPRSAQDDALGFARTCYDHLAGRPGVAIADALVARGHIVLTDEGGEVSDGGKDFFAAVGVDLSSPARSRRVFCKPCLDWSERRFHLAGIVGTVIWHRCLALDWLARERATRLVRGHARRRARIAADAGP